MIDSLKTTILILAFVSFYFGVIVGIPALIAIYINELAGLAWFVFLFVFVNVHINKYMEN